MAIFRYEAVEKKSGLPTQGSMEAANAQEVQLRLSERGYRSIQVETHRTPAAMGTANRAVSVAQAPKAGITFAPKVSPSDLAVFYRQMTSLLHSGFTPLSAVADLAPRTANRRISRAAADAAQTLSSGQPMAVAFGKHQDVFPPHVIGLIRAGELGGFLETAFEEAALGAEADAALRNGIWVSQLLIWQSVWSVLLLQPLVNNMTKIFSTGMPGLIGTLRDFLFLFLPLGILIHVAAMIAGWWWRQPSSAETRDRLLLSLPASRKLAKNRAIASFTRLLRRLLLSGISPEMAYTAAAQAVPNSVYRKQLMNGVPVLRAGNGLDAAIQTTGLMEHDPVQMLVTGQKTGQWTEMLDRVTAYYQDQAAKATEDAKGAQKRFAVLVTIVSSGYVLIAATAAPMQAALNMTEEWMK